MKKLLITGVVLTGFAFLVNAEQNSNTTQTTLYYDATNSRIGVNDLAPSNTLDVSGTIGASVQAATPSVALGVGSLTFTPSGTLCYVSGTTWVEVGQKATACSFVPSR